MSHNARSASFPHAGPAAWLPACPPCWRGFALQPLVLAAAEAPAIWAADFASGSYTRLGASVSLSAMLATIRNGPAAGLGADGVYALFGINEPVVLPGIGAEIWGQHTNHAYPSENGAHAAWGPTSATVTSKPVAALGGATVNCLIRENTETAGHGLSLAAAYRTNPGGEPYEYLVHVEPSSRRYQYIRDGASAQGPYAVIDTQTWTVTETGVSSGGGSFIEASIGPEIAGGARLVRVRGTRASGAAGFSFTGLTTGAPGTYFFPYAGDGASQIVGWGMQFSKVRGAPYHPATNGPATRFATDHRIPGFGELAAAGDFTNGFRIAATISLPFLSPSPAATVAAFGADADNCVKLQIGTDNKPRLVVRHGGSNALELATGTGFAAAGEKEIAAVIRSGGFSLAATGLEGAESSAGVALPDIAAADPSIGSLWNTVHLQGALKRMTLERTAS